jgi:hypothetical protein
MILKIPMACFHGKMKKSVSDRVSSVFHCATWEMAEGVGSQIAHNQGFFLKPDIFAATSPMAS